MPKKVTKKTSRTASSKRSTGLDFQKLIQTSNSYKSLIYGIITVVVLFAVIVLGIRSLSQNQQKEITTGEQITEESNQNSYTVVEGDTLWSIAENKYGDGFKWTEIAKANNIKNGQVEKGQKLLIPVLENNQAPEVTPAVTTMITQQVVKPTAAITPMASTQPKINGNTYKVVVGDNLWDICVRAYGDGYKWAEIARVNNIANPDLIFSGDTIKLPR